MDANEMYRATYTLHYIDHDFDSALAGYHEIIRKFPASTEAEDAKGQITKIKSMAPKQKIRLADSSNTRSLNQKLFPGWLGQNAEKYVITFFIWLAALNWPPILLKVTQSPLFFLPAIFWLNIPSFFGITLFMGEDHFGHEEFGIIPKTSLAWFVIAMFWLLVASILTIVTVKTKNRKSNHH